MKKVLLISIILFPFITLDAVVVHRSGQKESNCSHCTGKGKNKNYNPPDIEKIKRELRK